MKRGGQETYVGPLGRHSSQLIKYFEVGLKLHSILFLFLLVDNKLIFSVVLEH